MIGHAEYIETSYIKDRDYHHIMARIIILYFLLMFIWLKYKYNHYIILY